MTTENDFFTNLSKTIRTDLKKHIKSVAEQDATDETFVIRDSLRQDARNYFEALEGILKSEQLESAVESYYKGTIGKIKNNPREFAFYRFQVLEILLEIYLYELKGSDVIRTSTPPKEGFDALQIQREKINNGQYLNSYNKYYAYKYLLIDKPGLLKKKRLKNYDYNIYTLFKNVRDTYGHGTTIPYKPFKNKIKTDKDMDLDNRYKKYWISLDNDSRKFMLEIELFVEAMRDALIIYLKD